MTNNMEKKVYLGSETSIAVFLKFWNKLSKTNKITLYFALNFLHPSSEPLYGIAVL